MNEKSKRSGWLNRIVLANCLLAVAILIYTNISQAAAPNSKTIVSVNKDSDYKIVLKNKKTDEQNGSTHADIFFIINNKEYSVAPETWLISDYKEYRNKGKKIMGCSMGKKGTANGYNEIWVEKSGKFLVIKNYYIGGMAQVANTEIVNKIEIQ